MSILANIEFADIDINRLVQERCNSSALAMELCLSCTNPSIWYFCYRALSNMEFVIMYDISVLFVEQT